METYNQKTIRKMAKRNLAANRGRNVFLTVSIFLTAFMIATVLNLSINQVEMEYTYMLKYMGTSNYSIETSNYMLFFLVLMLMLAGFLFTYNVMSVSVARDIRFYGLLRTIGMSARQIKKVVLGQVLPLCATGIPLGLLFSALVSQAAVPLYLRMYPNLTEAGYPVRFHPLLFLGAALFAFGAVMAGAFRPAKKAAQVSPMEAVRFSEYGYTKRRVRTSAFRPVKMAWRNVFRVPKRTALVFTSLFLGMTMFLAVSVILGSASPERFGELATANARGDIYLRNDRAAQFSFGGSDALSVFDSELMEALDELPGLTKMSIGYFYEIRMNTVDREGEIQARPGYIYGVDEIRLAELEEELGYSIDKDAFARGELILVREIQRENLAGTNVAEFFLGDSDTPVSRAVGGILPPEFTDYFGTAYNWLPCVFVSTEFLAKLVEEPAVYDIGIEIERSSQHEALVKTEGLLDNRNNITLQSGIAFREEAETIISVLTVLGNSIAGILWLIGILNFGNIITTGILSRRHEIALLESVGQSKKQSKETLTWEGMIYASVTFALVCSIGGILTYGLYRVMRQEMDYMVFHFPAASFLLMITVIFAICLSIPRTAYSFISKTTIIERLREVE